MTPLVQVALTATPLAAYFYILGVFHGGRRPRMISGPGDVGLLAVGLGGLVAFGPFGRAVLGRMVGEPAGWMAWSIWVALVGLWALVLAGSATLRVTVYHISPEELDRAVREALDSLGEHSSPTFTGLQRPGPVLERRRVQGCRFSPTLKGYEDASMGWGVTVKPIRLLRSGGVDAYGKNPEVLIRELKPGLREALARLPQRESRVSHAMFGMACLTMLVPVSGFFLANPRAKEALRSLMHSLRWW